VFKTPTTLVLSHLKPYLCYAMCFTVHIILVNFNKHTPDLVRDTCLALEGVKRSISGPWLKKVVHHWSTSVTFTMFVMVLQKKRSRPALIGRPNRLSCWL